MAPLDTLVARVRRHPLGSGEAGKRAGHAVIAAVAPDGSLDVRHGLSGVALLPGRAVDVVVCGPIQKQGLRLVQSHAAHLLADPLSVHEVLLDVVGMAHAHAGLAGERAQGPRPEGRV